MSYRPLLAFVLLLASCSGGYRKADDPQDAGREFIRASLDGDYKKANFYLLKDSLNLALITRQERDYENLTGDQKREHRESSIRPISIRKVNDSATVYQYFSTYNTKDTTSLRIVRENGDWLVDLKSILKI